MSSEPRGLRLNNPMNIRHSNSKWQGLSEHQADPDFCQFDSVELGIRAGMKILQTYAGRRWDTVRAIVSHWAPPNENDTTVYINNVAAAVAEAPDDYLNFGNFDTMVAVCKAIIHQEQGQQPFGDEVFASAWQLAAH